MNESAAIETFDLTKEYRSFVPGRSLLALRGLCMSVPRGKVFGFLGPNGAGKTTTLRLLLGLSHPSSGSARILGRDIADAEVRRDVGYMAEKQNFYGYLRAAELLDYSARFYRMDGATRKDRTEKLLDYVGLADYADSKVKGFSLGMLRRLGLAQAMLHEPDLLLLDEPMAGLDPLGRKHFKDLIARACQEQGKTVFLCSHVLAEVEKICDMVGILNEGELLAEGHLSDLLNRERESVAIEPPAPGVIGRLEEAGFEHDRRGDKMVVFAADAGRLQQARKMLEAHGVSVPEGKRSPETLEEFFIRSISEAETERESDA